MLILSLATQRCRGPAPDPPNMSLVSDESELDRLRNLVGPSETAYAELLADRDEAQRVARNASAEVGELRGHIVELNTQVSRARQDQDVLQRRIKMTATERFLDRAQQRWTVSVMRQAEAGAMSPRFSVLTTVFDPEPAHLKSCLASIDAQTYCGPIEHVIVDDASTRFDIQSLLDELEPRPGRAVIRRSGNGGIVAASNEALEAATGEFVVLVDHDDVLAPQALELLVEFLDADPDIDVAYSDHDLLRPDGRCASPFYKPDFLARTTPEPQLHHAPRGRPPVPRCRRGRVRSLGTDGAQDHDLLLRLAERSGPFAHLPEVLLHWRQSPASVATDVANKPDRVRPRGRRRRGSSRTLGHPRHGRVRDHYPGLRTDSGGRSPGSPRSR